MTRVPGFAACCAPAAQMTPTRWPGRRPAATSWCASRTAWGARAQVLRPLRRPRLHVPHGWACLGCLKLSVACFSPFQIKRVHNKLHHARDRTAGTMLVLVLMPCAMMEAGATAPRPRCPRPSSDVPPSQEISGHVQGSMGWGTGSFITCWRSMGKPPSRWVCPPTTTFDCRVRCGLAFRKAFMESFLALHGCMVGLVTGPMPRVCYETARGSSVREGLPNAGWHVVCTNGAQPAQPLQVR